MRQRVSLRSDALAARLLVLSVMLAFVLLLITSIPASAKKMEQVPEAETLLYRLNLAWLMSRAF
jgi:hypothetical protein